MVKKSRISRARRVKLLLLDVDGVLTDGHITYTDRGDEIKSFDVQDGFGIRLFKISGGKSAVITARSSRIMKRRVKDLGIDALYQNARNKTQAYEQAKKRFQIRDEEACYVGDELIDLPVLKRVGFSVSVKNARPEVKSCCDWVTSNEGGMGAVREVIEFILKAQGKWKKAIYPYSVV
jgi:3-deoxy-D-manno-octulosonate 8-phosphate phosphatase (KDO 8-P phosphatase)